MKNKLFLIIISGILAVGSFSACQSKPADETSSQSTSVGSQTAEAELPDGEYSADFDTDSTMFHVNEADNGKGVLTVKDGKMTIHVSLASKGILNLFVGTAEDAQKDGAVLLEPTEDTVKYSDGTSDTVYGFDIPVEKLDEEFDVALIGKKGKWYDHKVSVSNAEKLDESTAENAEESSSSESTADVQQAEVTLEGGSGKASIQSPAELTTENGQMYARLVWSSTHYDYMIVDGEKYTNENEGGNSTFTVPIPSADCDIDVTADTTAMSTPHEIDYTLHFKSVK